MTNEARKIALTYVEACGRRDLDAIAPILAPDVQFNGPMRSFTGAATLLEALRMLGKIWVSNTVKMAIGEGAEACVLYDMETSTPAGTVVVAEFMRVEGGKIVSLRTLYDRVAFAPAREALERMATAAR